MEMLKEGCFYWFRIKGLEWCDVVVMKDGWLLFTVGFDLKVEKLDMSKYEFVEIKMPEKGAK